MSPWMRVTVGLVAAVVALLTVAAGAGVYVVGRSFPEYDGRVAVSGLGSRVEVRRDAYGVPQVYADSAEDLFFAQGFVHAQDRFFEMDFRRHLAAGRLAELFGAEALQADMVVRTLGWRRIAETELPLLHPTTRSYLEAYARGVNAYLAERDGAELSLEYAVLGAGGLDYRPEPWTAADSVSWLKAMAWELRGDMRDEIDRALAAARLPLRRVAQLYPPYPYDRHPPIVSTGAVVGGRFDPDATPGRGPTTTRAGIRPRFPAGAARAALRRTRRAVQAVPALLDAGSGAGSNAWAVSSRRSATGEPLLANDPHLAPSMPSTWYQVGLHCRRVSPACPFDVAGFSLSGLPGVVIGHNRRIAWGLSNLGPDVTDLYVEQLTGQTYRYGGRQLPLRIRTERLVVEGRSRPVRLRVRSTRHGPLLSDVSAQLRRVAGTTPLPPDGDRGDERLAIALRWTALDPGRTADAVFGLNAAGGWSEFRSAARLLDVPAQNLVYADAAGHIGYQSTGRIPVRRTGSGDWPAPGWNPRYRWSGYIRFRAMPSVLDPDTGYVVAANQAVTNPSYPHQLSDTWDYGYRSARIARLLQTGGRLDEQDMVEIQNDARSPVAVMLTPYLLPIELAGHWVAQGKESLRGWDKSQPANSGSAAFLNVVWRRLLALTFHDQLPRAAWPDGGSRWVEVVRWLLRRPGSLWWDDVATESRRESRDEILEDALRAARDQITVLVAREPANWQWGRLHRLELVHPALGRSGSDAVAWLFNRGPWPVGGGDANVLATGWDPAHGYGVDLAPSMRMVVSWADVDESRWVNLTGASGHAFHDHYADQTPLWVSGRTIRWPFRSDAVERATRHRLLLRPVG